MKRCELTKVEMTKDRVDHKPMMFVSVVSTRIAFKKISNGSLAYYLLSLINLQVKCTSLQYRYPNELLKAKQKTNLYSALFCHYLA